MVHTKPVKAEIPATPPTTSKVFLSRETRILIQRASLVAFGIFVVANLPTADAGPASFAACRDVFHGGMTDINNGVCSALFRYCDVALFGPDKL